MKVKFILICSSILFLIDPALGSETIRIALADNQKTVILTSSYGLLVSGRSRVHEKKRLVFDSTSVGYKPIRISSMGSNIQVNGKSYRGRVELRKKRNGLLLIINELDIEDYLLGVMASEIPPEWGYEALKAQAIAARTYALYQKRATINRPYHMLASVNSQVYKGNEDERPQGRKAVEETRGLVIVYQGEIIPAFYHASCGGQTENASELWNINAPYLKGVDCDCQAISRYGVWEKRVAKKKVINALRMQGYDVSDILAVNIEGITPAGRVKDVAISTPEGRKLIPAELLRSLLGDSLIPSVFFELGLDRNEVVFSGRGRGHGVGLCQWGAEEMAEQGHDFREILAHYYPGTNLIQLQ